MTIKSAKHFFQFSLVTITIFCGYIFAAVNSEGTTETAATETAANTPAPNILTSFSEGAHYITKFPDSSRAKGPVVVEFFSYMCPHCYRLEGTVKRWLKQKPEGVEFVKIPVAFQGNRLYALSAKAHYIAEELNIVDKFGDFMFKRIHLDRRPPRNDRDLANIFKELGVSDADYKKASENNFNVESKLRRANFLMNQYQVNGVPYILVNYKYEVGQESYKSEESLFNLWNNLPYKDFK